MHEGEECEFLHQPHDSTVGVGHAVGDLHAPHDVESEAEAVVLPLVLYPIVPEGLLCKLDIIPSLRPTYSIIYEWPHSLCVQALPFCEVTYI